MKKDGSKQSFVKGPNSASQPTGAPAGSAPAYGIEHGYDAIPPDLQGTLGANAKKGSALRQRAVDRHFAATGRVHPMDVSARKKSGKKFLRDVKGESK